MKQFRVERPKLRQVEKLRENKFKTAKIYLDLKDKVQGKGIGICIHYVALLLKISIYLSIYLYLYLFRRKIKEKKTRGTIQCRKLGL